MLPLKVITKLYASSAMLLLRRQHVAAAAMLLPQQPGHEHTINNRIDKDR